MPSTARLPLYNVIMILKKSHGCAAPVNQELHDRFIIIMVQEEDYVTMIVHSVNSLLKRFMIRGKGYLLNVMTE